MHVLRWMLLLLLLLLLLRRRRRRRCGPNHTASSLRRYLPLLRLLCRLHLLGQSVDRFVGVVVGLEAGLRTKVRGLFNAQLNALWTGQHLPGDVFATRR